jgi:hypothetical protein
MVGPLLTPRQLNRATLARQLLTARSGLDVVEAVGRLAGLQAQEARPPYVGLWSRLAGFQRAHLYQALHDRQVVRATGIRATLHIVTANDYVATRAALEPMLTDGMRALGPRLAGLDVEQTVTAARRHLADGPLIFKELRARLLADFPHANDRALGYVSRLLVPLVMVPTEDTWGFPSTASFTLAEQWLGRPLSPDGAAGDLVLRYLGAFGPATVADFQAWSGLSRARPVFESLRPRLQTFTDARRRELFDVPDAPRPAEDTAVPVRLLPEFDNLMLAYDDRTRIIAETHRGQVVTKNLRVNAVFLVDGVAAGLWNLERGRAAVTLTLRPFGRLTKAVQTQLEREAEGVARFTDPDATRIRVTFTI